MCGIAGVMALTGMLPPQVRAAVPAMTETLRHRGPDGEGFFSDPVAALGHRRLAIIDREGGRQPLSNEDGSCWLVFNGEIYNHRDLRNVLTARGHTFRTRSDTEAIVHAYEEFGVSCVDHLDGMFAFALYDQRNRQLLLARDRLGKKPLFYAEFGGVLHFASEIKALHASPAWDGTIDFEQLESYLSLGYFLAPGTVYRKVRKLLPGHCLCVRREHVAVRRYWDIERFDDWAGTEDEAVALVDDQIRERVRDRLESDVPLGAFLSGGIDSGLVVSFMAESHPGTVVTISVGFGDAAHDELGLAALTARRYSTDHHAHVISDQIDEAFDAVVRAFDEPFADSSSLPTWYVSREARRHVTVALSGDGGDETFGGYDFRYIPHGVEQVVRQLLPSAALRRAVGSCGAVWPRRSWMPRALRLGTYLENIGDDPEAAYYSDLCILKPDRARALMGRATGRDPRDSAVYDAVTAPYRQCASSNVVQRAEYADLKVYLPNDVLVKVDRMSMQHGLEVRCPLLDHRLVELAFRLPQSIKRADRRGKHLLKRVAAKRLPAALVRAPKHGFSAPVGSWLRGPLARRFQDEVLRKSSHVETIVNASYIRRAFVEHQRGESDQSSLLWVVWVLERWAAAGLSPASRPAASMDQPLELSGRVGS